MALDPSDPWTYLGLSQALISNGRPKEGRAYLDAAMRVDPGWTDWRRFQAGHAAFGEGRFEDAVAALEKIDVRSPDPWPKFWGLQVLISAYAHLGRSADAANAMAQFKTVLTERDEADYDRLRVQHYFVYKNEADIERLLDGLAKAGLPELPPDVDRQSKDRLTEAEIDALFFGHEVYGRRTAEEAAEYRPITSADGSTIVTIGSSVRHGMRWTQAGVVCTAYPKNPTSCGAVFRNPSGTFEQKNEYLMVYGANRFAFSVVK